MKDWHRLFGLVLFDYFTGSDFIVEVEKDLTFKKQLLDVVIVRTGAGKFPGRLPDGLEDLAPHNLISFKSFKEALDDWAIKELMGHYVNYRKQVSPSMQQLLPEGEFKIYGVCARYPHQLAAQVKVEEVQPGVHQFHWGTTDIRLIVLRDLPREEHNVPLHLFSAVPDSIKYGSQHYKPHSAESSTLILDLVKYYKQEGITMSYTMEDYKREKREEFLAELTPEKRKELVGKLPLEERLEGVSPEEILTLLPPEKIEAFLKKLKGDVSEPGK